MARKEHQWGNDTLTYTPSRGFAPGILSLFSGQLRLLVQAGILHHTHIRFTLGLSINSNVKSRHKKTDLNCNMLID